MYDLSNKGKCRSTGDVNDMMALRLVAHPRVALSAALSQGLTYALNEPCKEILYLPTSDAVKFKAKGWIDVFGSRCLKGIGSFVTLTSRGNSRTLTTYGGLTSFLVR